MPCTEQFCITATGLTPVMLELVEGEEVLAAAPAPDVEAVLELLAHIIAALVVRHGADWSQEEPVYNKYMLHSACRQ